MGDVFSIAPAGPVTPRHERVFRRKKATISTTQQPATITAPAEETTQVIGQEPANEPHPAAPQQDAPQPPEDEAPNQTVEARLSRIEERMQRMEHLLDLLVDHFLPQHRDR